MLLHDLGLYYISVLIDTTGKNDTGTVLIPIVNLAKDTVILGDSAILSVHFPLPGKFGLDSGSFELRNDLADAHLLAGIQPYAKEKTILQGIPIELKIHPSDSGRYIFYCYIVNKQGVIMGPTVYRSIHVM